MSTLVCVLRRDLRLTDNPLFHAIQSQTKFTHLLPIYILPPHQIEVSGFLSDPSSTKSPYPEARSLVGGFWRCGPHRATFISETVWDLKAGLKSLDSDLVFRVGRMHEVVEDVLKNANGSVGAVWITRDHSFEEMREEREIEGVVGKAKGVEWKVWNGEEMLIHDDDLPAKPAKISDVFTSFRKTVEPLKDNVRAPLERPTKLPPLPKSYPCQLSPFKIPEQSDAFVGCLLAPLKKDELPIELPPNAVSAHPFKGGETTALARVEHLLSSGAMTAYKDTRNGLLGEDFSTKLSAYLALGSITARQIHALMAKYEDGHGGENKGLAAVRFELLWRDYMRLCMRKYGTKLFSIHGFRGPNYAGLDSWKSLSQAGEEFGRFQRGETGTGLIDASMRELYLTGYTSNRARQNCASFLAKWMELDWRLGAEWYESMLLDYDTASNWGNWQYVAGVGNDPRGAGDGRKFNPVKQSHDYDREGKYVRTWVPKLRNEEDIGAVFQAKQGALVNIQWVKKGQRSGQGGRGGRGGRGRGGRDRRQGHAEKYGGPSQNE